MRELPQHLKGRHFIRVGGWTASDLGTVLDLADELKRAQKAGEREQLLPGRALAMIFQKPSTRTRVSFEVAISQLGGYGLNLAPGDMQLGRGETIRDTAHGASRFVDAILIRTFDQADVEEFAAHSTVPVINGLTDWSHPTQALADLMTIRERLGRLSGVRLAYVGDGNNMCSSLMVAAAKFGMRFVAATPKGYEPPEQVLIAARRAAVQAGGTVELVHDPHGAAKGADVLYTDVWTSMGQEDERERRREALDAFRIDAELVEALAAGRDRHALPPRPLRRGGHRGRPARAAVGGVGPGREPPALPEGTARLHRPVALPRDARRVRGARARRARLTAAAHRRCAPERRRRRRGREPGGSRSLRPLPRRAADRAGR